MSQKLKAVLEAADRLTVGAIAVEPFCVPPTPTAGSAPETPIAIFKFATSQGYDWLPVRDAKDQKIRRIVRTERLEHLSSWGALPDQAERVTVDHLVARDAPVFSILDRVVQRPLLCLGPGVVDGIVTSFDLNHPAAHYFGFALCIVIEAEVRQVVESCYPNDSAAEEAARAAGVHQSVIEKWRRSREAAEQLSLVTWLSFGDKLRLLDATGQQRLASRCRSLYPGTSTERRLAKDLWEVLALRNDVAHDKSSLADHRTMCERLRIAHALARALTAPE